MSQYAAFVALGELGKIRIGLLVRTCAVSISERFSTGETVLRGLKRSILMANSSGRVVINELPGEAPRLDYGSQIVPMTIREVKRITRERPRNPKTV